MTGRLIVGPNIPDGDGFYEALIDAHRALSPAQSGMLNAKLILLLANHIGDMDVLREAMAAARDGLGPPGGAPASLPDEGVSRSG